jgi:glyoxylase-like metal-dependent hydrolase (beta-lactamase superfamily II)/rhodanese-related sulfurtransferase
MYIEQIYTRHLSASAYYIESGTDAAIIDPMVDVQQYLDLAARRGTRIRFVFATHFQSDYVNGCLELSNRTKSQLVFGPGAIAGFPFQTASDGAEFKIGFLTIRALHTPGHTPESTCYLLLDDRNNPHSIFTGDTLFVDDVGRTDLFAGSRKETEQQAGILYNSLRQKLMNLPNYVVVYPGHGAGSACGKVIGKEAHSTIGVQRVTNYAFKEQTKEEFIRQVTENRPDEPPLYFEYVMKLNQGGVEDLEEVLDRNLKPLPPELFKLFIGNPDTRIIDTRTTEAFSAAHIPGSIFIGKEGNLELAAGLVLDHDYRLVVVCEPGTEKEIFTRLARTGFTHAHGFLEGGIDAWITSGGAVETLENISATEVAGRFRYTADIIIDVRNPNEWIPGIIAGAKLLSLQRLNENIPGLDRNKKIFVYCSCGYRSMIAASILKREGCRKVINVSGGMQQIRLTPIPVRQLSRIG